MIELTQHDQRILVNPDRVLFLIPGSLTHTKICYGECRYIVIDATMTMAKNRFKDFLPINDGVSVLINLQKVDYILENEDKTCSIFLNGIEHPFAASESLTKLKKRLRKAEERRDENVNKNAIKDTDSIKPRPASLY